MKRSVAVVVIFVLCHAMSAESDKADSSTALVAEGSNAVLTAANFAKIQEFILNEGERRTYCNRFNDNPYWAFTGFNAYLNPPDQGNINCEIGKSEFPTLVIQVTEPVKCSPYWDVHLDKAKKEIHIKQFYTKTDSRVLIREASEYFLKALAEIDEQKSKK